MYSPQKDTNISFFHSKKKIEGLRHRVCVFHPVTNNNSKALDLESSLLHHFEKTHFEVAVFIQFFIDLHSYYYYYYYYYSYCYSSTPTSPTTPTATATTATTATPSTPTHTATATAAATTPTTPTAAANLRSCARGCERSGSRWRRWGWACSELKMIMMM